MNKGDYKKTVVSLGCLVCEHPAELHHPRFACGIGQRESDWLVVPLCPNHHRLNGFGHAVHNGQATFEKNYMTESEMLAQVIQKITGGT